jgi:hypothetical protein
MFFAGWTLQQRSWVFPDSDRYIEAAYNISCHGELYARPWPLIAPTGQNIQEFTIRPPAYPLLVLALGGAKHRTLPIALLLVQNLLSIINIGVVVSLWARWATPNKVDWRWAGAILFFPAQLIYANALMSEVVLQTLVLGFVMYGLQFWQTQRLRYILGAAGSLCIIFLVKPVFFPFVGVWLLVGLGLGGYWKRPALAFVGLLPLLVAVLFMTWNGYRTGYLHFSSIAEINLLHYNAAGVVRQLAGPTAETQWVAGVLRAANAQPSFALRQQLIQAQASAVLWAHPVVYARQHMLGMVAFFLDPGRFDVAQFFHIAPPTGGGLLDQLRANGIPGVLLALRSQPRGMLLVLMLTLMTNLLRLGLAVRGFATAGKAGPLGRIGRWWLVLLILYVAFLTGPLGAARFLVPVWPLLVLLALCGLQPMRLAMKQAAPVGEDMGQTNYENGRS